MKVRMKLRKLRSLPAALVAAAFFMCGSHAVTQAAETVANDEGFAKSFLGKSYAGPLEIEGWTSFGGGLVSPPIYVNQYQHEDGTFLVLTSKETEAAGRSAPANFEVTDALIVPKPKKGYAFSTSCTKGDDHALRFMSEVSGRDTKEWWTNVRRAWEIELGTGKIATTKTRGVKCTNPDW